MLVFSGVGMFCDIMALIAYKLKRAQILLLYAFVMPTLIMPPVYMAIFVLAYLKSDYRSNLLIIDLCLIACMLVVNIARHCIVNR